jgi:cytochrome oxidase Cu insertion factor (SCO1/SenC/PrrC family)
MKILPIVLLLSMVAVAGCVGQQPAGPSETQQPSSGGEIAPPSVTDYRDFQLSDVATGSMFKLSDFQGKVVVLETFAVWCPLCLEQQREIQKAESQLNSPDVISVSLDIDPNEDEARVQGHLDRNGFTWRFAVAPREMARALSDEFGFNVLNPPSTPVIIIDRSGVSHLLPFGIKSSATMVAELQKYL